MPSTKSLVAYYERMECNNSLNKDIKMDNDSPRLSYETYQEQAICVSKMADPSNNTLNKYILIKCPTLSPPHGQTMYTALDSPHVEDMVININLLYDPNYRPAIASHLVTSSRLINGGQQSELVLDAA